LAPLAAVSPSRKRLSSSTETTFGRRSVVADVVTSTVTTFGRRSVVADVVPSTVTTFGRCSVVVTSTPTSRSLSLRPDDD